jgi:cell division protein FtsW
MPLSTPFIIAIKLSLRVFWLLCSYAVLYWLYLQWQTEPPRVRPAEITITLPKGESLTLGKRELAAPLAEREHVRLTHDRNGEWKISNISRDRRLELSAQDTILSPHALPLIAGQKIAVAGEGWLVVSAQPALELASLDGYRSLRFDGITLAAQIARKDRPLTWEQPPECADAVWSERIRTKWNQLAPKRLTLKSRLKLGGTVTCGLNVPINGLEPDDVWIKRIADTYVLEASPQGSRHVCIAPDEQNHCPPSSFLHDNPLSLTGISHLVAGRTRFAVQTVDDRLILKPLNRSLWIPPEIAAERLPELRRKGIEWTPRVENGWQFPLEMEMFADLPWQTLTGIALALCLVCMLATRLLLRATGFRVAQIGWLHAGAIAWSACAVVLSAFAWWAGTSIGQLHSLGLFGGSALLFAVTPQLNLRAQWMVTITGILMLYGLAAQFTLGLQAPDSGGWSYFHKFAATGSLLLSVCSLWLMTRSLPKISKRPSHPPHKGQQKPFRWHEGAIWFLALAALALLLIQLVAGAEEGVFGFQPVEFAKFSLILTSAHVLALLLEFRKGRGFWRRFTLCLRAALPVALLVSLVVLSLVLLKDYSPIVLLTAWAAGMLLAWTIAARSGIVLVVLLLTGVLLLGTFDWIQQSQGQTWLAAHGFYPERFAVWLDLAHHPHSGEQIRRASELIAGGGLAGSASVQGWSVPAVQSDFTPAWLIARFGTLIAASLMAGQAIWIASLLSIGWLALTAISTGDYVQAWRQRLGFFALWGFAGLMAGHFIMSWGTNLGWLPVMGQPMPLLATGSSLPLLLLLPMIMLGIPPANDR